MIGNVFKCWRLTALLVDWKRLLQSSLVGTKSEKPKRSKKAMFWLIRAIVDGSKTSYFIPYRSLESTTKCVIFKAFTFKVRNLSLLASKIF